MGRGRFAQWLVAPLVVACGLGACVAQTSTSEQIEQSASAISAPPGIPCAARADAVIASTGEVFSNSGSLVDSYQSSLGLYGGPNIGSNGNVQAAGAIVHNGGVIDGTQTPDVAAGLAIVPVPSGATNLPLGSKTPGNLNIATASESITLEPGNYVVANLTVGSPGKITIPPTGPVLIWVTGTLNLGGDENLDGIPENLEFLVTSSGTDNVNVNGELFGFVYAPTSVVNLDSNVFGGVVGTTVKHDPRFSRRLRASHRRPDELADELRVQRRPASPVDQHSGWIARHPDHRNQLRRVRPALVCFRPLFGGDPPAHLQRLRPGCHGVSQRRQRAHVYV
jgi:hypothetical protein